MPLLDAKRLAAALLPHIDKDRITPVLNHVVFRNGSEGGVFAYASDRYTIGRYDLTNIVEGDFDDMMIPRNVLAAVAVLGKATLPRDLGQYRIEFEQFASPSGFTYFSATAIWHNADEMEDTHWQRRWDVLAGGHASDRFPNVEKLFAGFIPGEVSVIGLGPEQLEKFTGYARATRFTPIKVTLAATGEGRNRLAPHLIEIGDRFKGLIQPNLLLNNTGYGTDLAAENVKRAEEARAAADAAKAEVTDSE
jgi:hypothetical protein